MVNFKKVIPFIIAVLFFTDALYSEDSLRVPVGETETYNRIGANKKSVDSIDWKDLVAFLKGQIKKFYYVPEGDREDIIQETLTRILKDYGKFEGRASLKRWASIIMRNVIITTYFIARRDSSRVPREDRETEAVDEYLRIQGLSIIEIPTIGEEKVGYEIVDGRVSEGAIGIWLRDQSDSVIAEMTSEEALRILKPKDSEVISLYYIDGLNLGEIAEKLNISYESARSRYRRGMAGLRNFYKVKDQDSTSKTESLKHSKSQLSRHSL